ncbi:MAG: DUF3110 domain-containing protein [Pseudanabaenaceae cyanobacterium]
MAVWVLLYNPHTDNEGIYTQLINDRNIVLAFEDEDDAVRYAGYLEAQDFPTPTPEAIDQAEVEEFCQSAGYEFYLVPAGELLVPPEKNVEQTDWQPDEKDLIEEFRRRLENLF